MSDNKSDSIGSQPESATPKPLSAPSSQEVRDKAAAARKKVDSDEKRRLWLVRGGLAAVVLIILVGIGVVVALSLSGKAKNTPVAGGELPPGVSKEDPGWKASTSGSGDTIAIFEDFQCPACDIMEKTYGAAIQDTYVKPANVNVVYYPMSFLDANLRNTSSAEAANAFGCAIQVGAGEKYREVVFANQPEREGAGYTKEQLKQFGKDAGVSDAQYDQFATCVDNKPFLGWGPTTNQYAAQQNVTGTPTIIVNGKQIDKKDMTSQSALFAAIDKQLASN